MVGHLTSLPFLRLVLAAAIGWLSAPLGAQGDQRWPFGVEDGNDRAFAKRDLYSLGLIGAKAWDADLPEPEVRRTSGRRTFEGGQESRGDAGPTTLVIRAILGDGPGQRAGLKLGDRVVGVNKKSFAKSKGSLASLADALVTAESKSGSLTLQLERDGEAKSLKVTIPVAGKAAQKPSRGAQRDAIVTAATRWLADRQSEDGGFPATLGGSNGRSVLASLAGLAWIGSGSTLSHGPYRDQLIKAKDFVVRSLEAKDGFRTGAEGANWDQTNWKLAYAGIFLGELQLASPDQTLKPVLQSLATTLTDRHEASGGYAHGPGGPNALGYLELNILGGFVLSALSLAKQAGATVDEAAIAGLNAYLEESSAGSGGVAYSTNPGQKGQGNVGRTAVAWLGDVGLGYRKKPWTRKMEKYLKRHIADVLDGHASLMQHITLAGVAAAALGGRATKDYWKAMERDLTLARCPDGSIQMRPWHESLRMSSNSDVSMGEVWSTASWTIVLVAGGLSEKPSGLPGWCGERVK